MTSLQMFHFVTLTQSFKVAFKTLMSRQLWAGAELRQMTWIELANSSWNGIIEKVCICDLDLSCPRQRFEILISRKRLVIWKKSFLSIVCRLIFTIKSYQCECCTPWPRPTLSRPNVFLLNMRRERMSRNIFLTSHGHRRGCFCRISAADRVG